MDKINNYIDTYLNLQFKTISKIQNELETLRPSIEKDQKKYTMYTMLDGYNRGLAFRLKGIINCLKEVYDVNVKIPENVEDIIKTSTEFLLLREDGELVTNDGTSYSDLLKKLMLKE